LIELPTSNIHEAIKWPIQPADGPWLLQPLCVLAGELSWWRACQRGLAPSLAREELAILRNYHRITIGKREFRHHFVDERRNGFAKTLKPLDTEQWMQRIYAPVRSRPAHIHKVDGCGDQRTAVDREMSFKLHGQLK